MRRSFLQMSLAVLLFDAVGSLAAAHWHSDFARLRLGSDALYLLTGLLAGWRAAPWSGIVVGGGVGLVDGLIGWPLSAALGPAALGLEYHQISIPQRLVTAAIVAGLAAILGGCGGFIATLGGGRPRTGPG